MRVRSDVVRRSNVPSQPDRKNRAGRAIRDHNRRRAPEAPPIPTQPVAARNRRAAPRRIASPRDLRLDVLGRLAARRAENDKNLESKPAESPLAAGRSLSDEFAPTTADHTILARRRRDEICRATQNLPLRVRAVPRQFPSVAKPMYLRARRP